MNYLGVDAGNSKTVALVCDERGAVTGWGRAGVGDIYGAPDAATAVRNVVAAVDAALSASGAAAIRAAAFCLAGVDWPEDEQFWRDEIGRRYPGFGAIIVRNDGFATLGAGAPDGIGIAVVAGTGPAVVARTPDGTERHLGFWCFHALGGAGLGADGLRAVFRAHQGLAPTTALTQGLTDLYREPDVDRLLHAFTRRTDPIPQEHRNRAARVVLACADAGDPVARDLVDGQARAFADYARRVGRQAGFDTDHADIPIFLGGSVATSTLPALRDRLIHRITEQIPAAHITTVVVPPAIGALNDALRPDNPSPHANPTHTSLPLDLFHTD